MSLNAGRAERGGETMELRLDGVDEGRVSWGMRGGIGVWTEGDGEREKLEAEEEEDDDEEEEVEGDDDGQRMVASDAIEDEREWEPACR